MLFIQLTLCFQKLFLIAQTLCLVVLQISAICFCVIVKSVSAFFNNKITCCSVSEVNFGRLCFFSLGETHCKSQDSWTVQTWIHTELFELTPNFSNSCSYSFKELYVTSITVVPALLASACVKIVEKIKNRVPSNVNFETKSIRFFLLSFFVWSDNVKCHERRKTCLKCHHHVMLPFLKVPQFCWMLLVWSCLRHLRLSRRDCLWN